MTYDELKQLLDLLIKFKEENGREQMEPLKTTVTMVINAMANTERQ